MHSPSSPDLKSHCHKRYDAVTQELKHLKPLEGENPKNKGRRIAEARNSLPLCSEEQQKKKRSRAIGKRTVDLNATATSSAAREVEQSGRRYSGDLLRRQGSRAIWEKIQAATSSAAREAGAEGLARQVTDKVRGQRGRRGRWAGREERVCREGRRREQRVRR
ncbi:hypothetical protein Cni_G25023 [Canna indica]|uniref:Uncharacterized protein n=1 Tax=Canna indica TaxID=4628 RepID=A0AAQ3KWU4_9LILI|nr:hypothetical protein Cni_G25023 [Canna indica]